MKLSIFHDGQFFVGVVEYQEGFIHKYLKVTFGNEPSDETVLRFITFKLIPLLNQTRSRPCCFTQTSLPCTYRGLFVGIATM